jgi:hypothetical protein
MKIEGICYSRRRKLIQRWSRQLNGIKLKIPNQKTTLKPSTVGHICNPKTPGAEAGRLTVQGWHELQIETLSQKPRVGGIAPW